MANGIFIFIGFVIVLFALWLGGGGANRPISFQGPYLKPIATTATTAEAYGQSRSAGSPGFVGNFFGGGPSVTTISNGGVSASVAIPDAEASKYRGIVFFSRNPGPAKSSDASEEYVDISLGSGASDSIDITGWKLVSDTTKKSATIPAGAEVPRTGVVNASADIMLSPGTEALIVSGRSPVGASFRENKCTGYFEQYQEFYPPLVESCPTGGAEYIRLTGNTNDECLSFARSVPYCQTFTGTSKYVSSQPSSSCQNFMNTYLTYNGCVANHANDTDFKGNTWRVFLSSSSALWDDSRDTIRLLDKEGKTVDVLSY